VLVLPHGAIKRLVETGSVDVWTPAMRIFDGETVEASEPALNVQHVVRRRYAGQAITHAQARGEWVTVGAVVAQEGRDQTRTFWRAEPVRRAALQDLTVMEAAAAGFKTRDDFYDWWRGKYATGPRMARIDCYVVTYDRVDTDAAYYLAKPIPGKQADYTHNASHAIDDLETVDADEWARKAEKDRELHSKQARSLWRARRRRRAA
jgi:hypothetical protein